MSAELRREILDRMNSLDTGPTEEERKVEWAAGISRTIAAEGELKWGRIAAGGLFGLPGVGPDFTPRKRPGLLWRIRR